MAILPVAWRRVQNQLQPAFRVVTKPPMIVIIAPFSYSHVRSGERAVIRVLLGLQKRGHGRADSLEFGKRSPAAAVPTSHKCETHWGGGTVRFADALSLEVSRAGRCHQESRG